jgi:hypothetical protein
VAVIWFRISPHSVRSDTEVVEVFDDNRLLATVYPMDEYGIRVMSKNVSKFHAVPPPPGDTTAVEAIEVLFRK